MAMPMGDRNSPLPVPFLPQDSRNWGGGASGPAAGAGRAQETASKAASATESNRLMMFPLPWQVSGRSSFAGDTKRRGMLPDEELQGAGGVVVAGPSLLPRRSPVNEPTQRRSVRKSLAIRSTCSTLASSTSTTGLLASTF